MPTRLAVEPTSCRIRHIVRAATLAEPGARQVGGMILKPVPIDGVNGPGGWISGTVDRRMNEEGKLTLRFANATGPDGRLHRERFAILTDPTYRIGDEWIEVVRDAHYPMIVATPVSYELTRTDLTIECADALALSTLAREETAHRVVMGPRDAIEHYGRLDMLWSARDFRGWSWSGGGTVDGWEFMGAGPADGGAGVRIRGAAGTLRTVAVRSGTAPVGDCWSATFRLSVLALAVGDSIRVSATGDALLIRPGEIVAIPGYPTYSSQSLTRSARLATGAALTLRLYRRGEWVTAEVDGETIGMFKSPLGSASTELQVMTSGAADVVVHEITAVTTRRFLVAAEEPGDLHLPGAPPPGGLWGAYFMETNGGARARTTTEFFEALTLHPLQDPYFERLDATVNFPGSANDPSFQPPGPPNGQYFSVRWTGSVYLDLAASDRFLHLRCGRGDMMRTWVGHRRTTYTWQSANPQTGPSLRTHIGSSAAGWYPIVIEWSHAVGTAFFGEGSQVVLADLVTGGTPTPIPTSRLSPYGVVNQLVQRESHREMVRQLSDAFGMQWTVQPRTFESGSFPGRIVPRVRLGRDTSVVIESDDALGVKVSGTAADSADRVQVDAAGLARPDGAGGLTAEVWDTRGREHVFAAVAQDQASDVTDPRLAEQRARSLLALHLGVNERVEAQPPGQRVLVDSWPLTGVVSRMNWEPGDGIRLNLPEIRQVDARCRQLLGLAWTIRPGGVSSPTASWRSRPVGAVHLMQRALRTASTPRRAYQGQIVEACGSLGASSTQWATDGYSRLYGVPRNRVVRLVARVGIFGGSGNLYVNDVDTGLRATRSGEYDVTGWTDSTATGYFYARVVGTVQYQIQLAALVKA